MLAPSHAAALRVKPLHALLDLSLGMRLERLVALLRVRRFLLQQLGSAVDRLLVL